MTRAERKAHTDRMNKLRAEASAVVATGKCPQCGSALRRNLALAGWWQCGAFGEVSFRSPEYKNAPKCNFQVFTE